ncbi:MAG: O-antigen ligase family protein [Candidatus Magasanikbacteria bacterium]|nr:O-antigen ligase family protein [Candidatus Magasanikbacteria bacterium]
MATQNRILILKKAQDLILIAFLFLLPWQTRYIWHYGQLNGGYWEYGTGSIYATEILLWIILILFFVNNFLNKEVWAGLIRRKNILAPVFLLFLAVLGFSVVFSENIGVSYGYVFHILEGMALMTVLVRSGQSFAVIPTAVEGSLIPNQKDSSITLRSNWNDKYLYAIWLGAVGQGMLAMYQFLNQSVFASKWLGMAGQEAYNLGPSVIEFADQRWLRAYGSFGSPNSLGIYLAVLFVLGLILYLKTESPRYKILISIGQLFVLSGLLVSFSRGAWLAAVAGVLCLFIILIYKRKPSFPPQAGIQAIGSDTRFPLAAGMTNLKEFAKQIVFVLAVVVFWVAIFYPVFNARFNLQNRLEIKSVAERQEQYSGSLAFIKVNSVLGVGPGAYTYALYKKYSNLASWQYQPIHNIYLLGVVEMGVVAAVLLAFLIANFAKMIIKNNIIYLPVLTALLVSGLFDHWLASLFTGIMLWWVIWGLGLKRNS